MFNNPPPSPLDLNFRLFGTAIRIHPFFWVVSLLFGDFILKLLGLEFLLIWVACVTVSILLHEFGHVWAFRWFGVKADIVLHAFGGLAIPRYGIGTPWKNFAVSFAGPLMNLAIVGVTFAASRALHDPLAPPSPYLFYTLEFLFLMNLFWFVVNLLPIYPLDGGQMFRSVVVMAGSRQPAVVTHITSILVCVFFIAWGLAEASGRPVPVLRELFFGFWPSLFNTIFFALLAFENYQMMENEKRLRRSFYYDDEAPPWSRR